MKRDYAQNNAFKVSRSLLKVVMFSIIFLYVVCRIFWKIISKMTAGNCISDKCLVGKTAIVTGGNSGIGFETSLDLAKRGCKVIIADIENSEKTVEKIIEETENENVFFKLLDLSSLGSVRKFSKEISSSENGLDILINNAGVAGFAGIFTSDGLLKTMQINYFGHFLLTHLLVGLLKKSRGRIVFLSSSAAFTHSLTPSGINRSSNTMFRPLNVSNEYSNSKLCSIIAAEIFAEKLKNFGISCYSVHPGVIRSSLFSKAFNNSEKSFTMRLYYLVISGYSALFGKTPKEGSQAVLHCALLKSVQKCSGKFFWNNLPCRKPTATRDVNFCESIWKTSEDLVKLEFREKI